MPGLLGARRKLRRVPCRIAPAKPHLQCHRPRRCADGRIDQALGVIEIAHQRRSRQPAGHLLRRASHVEVDDVGARRLGDLGRPARSSAPRARQAGSPSAATRRRPRHDARHRAARSRTSRTPPSRSRHRPRPAATPRAGRANRTRPSSAPSTPARRSRHLRCEVADAIYRSNSHLPLWGGRSAVAQSARRFGWGIAAI